jgi:FMN-dependent NADH-azoreductase
MPVLLSIQASSRGEASVSRILSDKFIEQWQRQHPDGYVIVRDLVKTPLPFLDITWITGAYTPDPQKRSPEMRAALSVSDELVTEIKSADHLLFGVPMLNFSVPAVLKAYLDQVVRLNETFSRETGGLIKGKTAKIILASGRIYTPGAADEHLDYASGLLRTILAYIGITDVDILPVGGALGIARGLITVQEHIAKFESAVMEMAV